MKKLILILLIGSLFSKEEVYAELKVMTIEMEAVDISLRIVADKDGMPTERIAMYFNHSIYNYAIYLNKEKRQEMMDMYDKYEKWK